VYNPLRHQYEFQCRGNIKITDRGSELVTYFLLAGDRQLPPVSPAARDHRRPVMTSSILPCVVQSCTGASPRGLYRSSSSRDGQGQGQAPAVLGRVSMTPPSSLGRYRKQLQQVPAGESWLSADPPVRRLAAPPSSLTVPVAGEWLERGGRSPDLPVVHYCNANIVQGAPGSRGGSVDGCIHIRGMSESSVSTCTPTGPPVQQQRRRLSSSGDPSAVAASPTTPVISLPGWSPALRDGVVQGRVLQRIGELPNESGESRRRQPIVEGDGQYDIDAIMRELQVDVERIVASPPTSSRLVNQSVQTGNLAPASTSSSFHHHHQAVPIRAADQRHGHLPSSAADVDHRLRRTANHAATSAGLQPPLGAVQFTSVREPSRPMNLIKLNGAICNNFIPNNSRRFIGAVDPSVRALTNNQVETKVSPPPLPPPPANESQQRDGHLLQRGQPASAFKPVSSAANNRSLGLQLLTNNVDKSPFRAHPLATRPVPGVNQLNAEPQPLVRRRLTDASKPTAAVLGPSPSFRVRRSVCVPSLPRLCRSLENIASDVDDSAPRSESSSRPESPAASGSRQRRPSGRDNHHQLLLLHPDDVSLSSFDGTASEMSRSDPALSSYGDTSEYDNYRPGMASDEDYFIPEPISDVDIDLFDDIDVDNVEVSDTYAALDAVAIPPLRRRVVDDV